MSTITVANIDWSIVEAVKAALAGATIADAAVFESVSVTTSEAHAEECQFHASPIAVVRYVTTRENVSPEDVRGCWVALELTVAVMVDSQGWEESPRLAEILRLKNAAVNAVETDPPACAHAWGDGDHYHRRIEWGAPRIDTSVLHPWAVCRLPVEVGFVLDDGTCH